MNRNHQPYLNKSRDVYVLVIDIYEYEIDRASWDRYHLLPDANTDSWLNFYRYNCSYPDGTSRLDWIKWRPITVPKDGMDLTPEEFDKMVKKKVDAIFMYMYKNHNAW